MTDADMTIGRLGASPEDARPSLRLLREVRDRVATSGLPGVTPGMLSMGMSADLEVAVEEGATLVRVGTAVFGSRPFGDEYDWPGRGPSP